MPMSPLAAALMNPSEVSQGSMGLNPMMFAPDLQLGQQLTQEGLDASPIRSPWQGVARLAQAIAGRYVQNQGLQQMGAMQGDLAQEMAAASHSADPVAALAASTNPLVRAMLPQLAERSIQTKLDMQKILGEQHFQLAPDGSLVPMKNAPQAVSTMAGAEESGKANAQGAANLYWQPQIETALVGPKAAQAGAAAKATYPYDVGKAIAAPNFEYQHKTQTVTTPPGPRIMTGAQAEDYAKTGNLPSNGVGTPPVPNTPGPIPGVPNAAQPTPSAPANGAPPVAPPPLGSNLLQSGQNTGNAPGVLQDPEIKKAQIAEIADSQKRFRDAQVRLQNLGQLKTILANPNLITGAHGDELQAMRGSMLQAYTQLGIQPPQDLVQGVASAEALKAAANNLAIEVSKDEGVGTPRVSIFNAISQNKPGITTSKVGNLVRVLSMEQAAKRESDFGQFAPTYYQQAGNYNKQDAEAAFAKVHPNSEYTRNIFPESAQDFARLPIGSMYVAPDGNVYTKMKDAPAQ